MTYHIYTFFDTDKAMHDLPAAKVKQYKQAFIAEIKKSKTVLAFSFTTLGLKVNTSFLLWLQSDSLEDLQDLLNALMHTQLGKYLKITYNYFSLARPTQYAPGSQSHTETGRKGGKYLVIYPFTKTKDWHMLDFATRKDLMQGHMAIGRRYPQIAQLLLYSYGVDDSEFIVSYETDNLPDFQKLVMDLRSDKVRMYTKSDTPIFTCLYRSLEKTMDFV